MRRVKHSWIGMRIITISTRRLVRNIHISQFKNKNIHMSARICEGGYHTSGLGSARLVIIVVVYALTHVSPPKHRQKNSSSICISVPSKEKEKVYASVLDWSMDLILNACLRRKGKARLDHLKRNRPCTRRKERRREAMYTYRGCASYSLCSLVSQEDQ